MRRRLSALATVPLLLLSAAACGGEAERDESGSVTAESDVDVASVRKGDCIASAQEGEVESLTVVPCDQPHGAEAFDSYDLPEGDFPEQATVDAEAEQRCTESFEDFVGLPYDESVLEVSQLTPTPESFGQGDRTVLCFITDPEGDVTGSLADAGR